MIPLTCCAAKRSEPEHYIALKSDGSNAVEASQAFDSFTNLAC